MAIKEAMTASLAKAADAMVGFKMYASVQAAENIAAQATCNFLLGMALEKIIQSRNQAEQDELESEQGEGDGDGQDIPDNDAGIGGEAGAPQLPPVPAALGDRQASSHISGGSCCTAVWE